MRFFSPGIMALVLGYTLSQFYRVFLAVLTPTLQAELGVTPGQLALSSGLWFLAFAAMQLPVGWALDNVGPRRTVALMLGLAGASGAAVFAAATQVWHLHAAMLLLGVGCAPVLMGAYYIFAREFPPAVFGSLAGFSVGFGSLGNILGATPLVIAVEAIGWRQTLWVMAGATLLVGLAVLLLVRDPARIETKHQGGALRAILRIRALWFILPLFFVSYAAFGAIRGLWAGPYLGEVFGASPAALGHATLLMGLAMIAGNFLIGPFVRLMRGLRRSVLAVTGGTVATMLALAIWPGTNLGLSIVLLTLVGLSGAGFALIMSHGRLFLPAHLVGRGVTFLNMMSIGGVGVMQFASRPVYGWATGAFPPAPAYAMLWLFFAIPLVIGLALYFLTPEGPDG